MNSTYTMPKGCGEILRLDLQKDKKTALLVNGLALVIFFALFVPACFFHSFLPVFEGPSPFWLKWAVMIPGMVAYIVLHEAVHGITMKLLCPGPVHFGFTGLYAFAGSDAYYIKGDYILIAMAPVVFWGLVLGILNVLVPEDWFWIVYLIQLSNLSGAGGDLYVTWKMTRLPEDILVRDSGVAMTVYGRQP